LENFGNGWVETLSIFTVDEFDVYHLALKFDRCILTYRIQPSSLQHIALAYNPPVSESMSDLLEHQVRVIRHLKLMHQQWIEAPYDMKTWLKDGVSTSKITFCEHDLERRIQALKQ
jgi:hypothetical protein